MQSAVCAKGVIWCPQLHSTLQGLREGNTSLPPGAAAVKRHACMVPPLVYCPTGVKSASSSTPLLFFSTNWLFSHDCMAANRACTPSGRLAEDAHSEHSSHSECSQIPTDPGCGAGHVECAAQQQHRLDCTLAQCGASFRWNHAAFDSPAFAETLTPKAKTAAIMNKHDCVSPGKTGLHLEASAWRTLSHQPGTKSRDTD